MRGVGVITFLYIPKGEGVIAFLVSTKGGHVFLLHGIKPVRLNGSFDSKCTRPETSHSYQSFTILINTFTGIIVYWHNLRFKWHNYSRHQTVK